MLTQFQQTLVFLAEKVRLHQTTSIHHRLARERAALLSVRLKSLPFSILGQLEFGLHVM